MVDCAGIFCRTYWKDAERLAFLLKSIEKYCVGFAEVVIATPASSLEVLKPVVDPFSFASLVECSGTWFDWIGQQITKLMAHRLTTADLVIHVDSDCVLFRETFPSDLLRNGKPILYHAPYSYFYESSFYMLWQAATSQLLQRQVDLEFMRHFPLVYPRQLYIDLERWYIETYKEEVALIEHRIHGDNFSEFNLMGAFSYHSGASYHEHVNVLNEVLHECVRQFCLHNSRDDRSIPSLERVELESLVRA